MAVQDIIQDLIFQPGQSQDQRKPAELGIHFADIDERTDEELLLFTRKFAEFVRLYLEDPSMPADEDHPKTQDWIRFFPSDIAAIRQLLNDKSGEVTPHLALYLSFLKLYQTGPQECINKFTGRHLGFYFSEVLRLRKKNAIPDKTHVAIELKKNSTPISLDSKDLFSAGKDDAKVELIYAPTTETIINTAKVDSLCSFFNDKAGQGTIRYAPVANSADGMGGKLTGIEPKWAAFGYAELPAVEIGFGVASPVLRMKEGSRKVTLNLTLDKVNSTLTDTSLKGAFQLFVTGEKSWLGPYEADPTFSEGSVLSFTFTIPASEKAVVDYHASLHGYHYTCQSPVIQVLLKTDRSSVLLGYEDFDGIKILKAGVDVDVSGITSLSLEGDQGTFNPQKPFAPFGMQPSKGSGFLVGYPEALDKKLTELIVSVKWKNPPEDFGPYYSAYGENVSNEGLTADVVFNCLENRHYARSGVPLFEKEDARKQHDFVFNPGRTPLIMAYPTGRKVFSLRQTETSWSKRYLREMSVNFPVLTNHPALPDSTNGYISFTLNNSFFHAEYPKKTVENILAFSKQEGTDPAFVSLNEPYTPVIQNISLSYKASSGEINVSSNSLDDFTNDEIQFFQVAYLGQIQEHGYQRCQFDYLADKLVSLFPEYKNEGELLIGFTELNPGDSVSVLFQVAEGSEDPDLPQENVDWSVLSDNYWKPMSKSEVVLDSTNQLLRSGIIKFVIPHDATTMNTLLPGNRIWIKAAMRKNVNAVCRMVEVIANAIEVQFTDRGNDPTHLASPMEKGRIAKLKNGNAAVKSVSQPFSSFGGSQAETSEAFYTRSSERLRHKYRCITAWDYERIVLQEFPEVHKVKCIPHAKFIPGMNKYCWLAPGNVVLVVVPDTTNKNAVDPLAPKINGNAISRITELLKRQTGMQVNVTVKNPAYQKLQLEFRVKFLQGYEFNFYSEKLKEQIKQFLSPWAYSDGRDISFGGKIYKSVLLDFVEDIDYVDFVEDFYLYSISESSGKSNDLNEVQPESPDTILVSAPTHIIHQIY